MLTNVNVIGFDADDTLWVNEPYFQDAEKEFCLLFKNLHSQETVSKELLKTEIGNIELYGYGAKGFMLSMIETALKLSGNGFKNETICNIIKIGKNLLNRPIVLLEDVKSVLSMLKKSYKLIVATKGDLLDQERKLDKSGLSQYFHHIEIMSDKKTENYSALLRHLEIEPHQFAMVGNSIKSDIQPVIEIGGFGIHVPYHTTWAYEQVIEAQFVDDRLYKVEKISDIVKLF